MRPIRVSVTAAGNSQWIPLDYLQPCFAVGLAVVPWENGSGLEYTVQHTFDDLVYDPLLNSNIIAISRSGTTATVTDTGPDGLGHGMSTGDNVVISSSGSKQLDSPKTAVPFENGDLGWDITVTGVNTYTYTCTNAGPTADSGSARVVRMRVFPHAVLNTTSGNPGATGLRSDGNYAFPPRACRIKLNTFTAGGLDFMVIQGTR